METPGRKSTRRRQPNKKYSVDAFEGLEAIEGVDDHDEPKGAVEGSDDDEDDDFQFEPEASPELPEDDLSVDGEGDDRLAPDTGFDDVESVIGGSEAGEPISPPSRKNKPDLKKAKHDPRYNPRGILEPAARGSKELQRLYFFGPSKDDQAPAIQAHFRWGSDTTIPSRKNGFSRSYYHNEESIKIEIEKGWVWYDAEGGRTSFLDHQLSISLSSEHAQAYIISDKAQKCKLLMGSYKNQRLFEIGLHDSMSLNDAWLPDAPSVKGTPQPNQDPRSVRNGWMLNAGGKIQQMEWVSNQEKSRQFLALSTAHLTGYNPAEQPFNSSSAPAFTPRPPTKSAIQIWEFHASAEDGRIDMNFAPKLRKLVCTEWGDIKQFKWCPTPRKFTSNEPSKKTNLGLLAGIWGDGVLRVLDISVDSDEGADTEYELVKSSAFSAKPPQTVCTCLAWMSSYSLVAGCADGYVGIWHLPSALRERSNSMTEQSHHNAEPVIFSAISTTYLLEVTTGYPSRPNLILTSSMSGYIQMTDITELSFKAIASPAATIRASRSRMGRSVLLWHDFAQVIMSVDENYTLVAYPVRRFFRQISFTRYSSSALSVALSPVHPFVMAGCVGGETVSNNPLRRAFETKIPIWNQTWFTHEWTQQKAGQTVTDNTANTTADNDGDVDMTNTSTIDSESNDTNQASPQGISRILEGFKCKEIKLFNTDDAFQHRENGAVFSTVYDLKQSVTSLAWNPNVHVGGWIAAGIANGLLRVENITT